MKNTMKNTMNTITKTITKTINEIASRIYSKFWQILLVGFISIWFVGCISHSVNCLSAEENIRQLQVRIDNGDDIFPVSVKRLDKDYVKGNISKDQYNHIKDQLNQHYQKKTTRSGLEYYVNIDDTYDDYVY